MRRDPFYLAYEAMDDPDDDTERVALIYRLSRHHHLLLHVENIHETPREAFAINMGGIRKALNGRSANNVVGVLHTHPWFMPSQPSEGDIAGMRKGLLGVVYHQARQVATWYDRKGVWKNGRISTTRM